MRRFPHLLSLTLAIIMLASATQQNSLATPNHIPARAVIPFDLSRITKEMTKEFEKAWRVSKGGTSEYEGVVLFYLLPDGSYQVEALNATNEYKKVSFKWDDRIIAIFHTHPNVVDPKPSWDDIKLAGKYNVLMFTLSMRGMYVYDPGTKKTSSVMYGLDWLDESKWTDELSLKMANLSPSFSSKLMVSSSQ